MNAGRPTVSVIIAAYHSARFLKYAPYLGGTPAGPIPLVATGNLLVFRAVWDAAGPFVGSVFCGDALLSWRAREAGFVPWYEPGAVVIDQEEHYRRGFFAERYRRGREFGRFRAGKMPPNKRADR